MFIMNLWSMQINTELDLHFIAFPLEYTFLNYLKTDL